MSKWYPQAIEALKCCDNPKAWLYEVAKKNPKAIVDASDRIEAKLRLMREDDADEATKRIIDILRQKSRHGGSSYIEAIKFHRSVFGSQLKEAKEAVDSIRDRFGF